MNLTLLLLPFLTLMKHLRKALVIILIKDFGNASFFSAENYTDGCTEISFERFQFMDTLYHFLFKTG